MNNPAEQLLRKVLEECVENAGSDDPTFHPPSTNLLSEISLFLVGGVPHPDSPEEFIKRRKYWTTPEEMLKCKGRVWTFTDEYLGNEIQLHEQVEIYYVVDGWLAKYSFDDGNTWPVEQKDSTPLFALAGLAIKINGLKAKRRAEGGYH